MKKKCFLLKYFPDKLTPAALNDLMAVLEKCSVCPGHPDKHFVEMAQSKKGELKSSDGKTVVATVDQYAPVYVSGQKYDSTVRCTKCTIIVQDKIKCSSCVAYRGTLRKAYHHWTDKLNSSPDRCTAPSRHVNFRFLSTPQKQTHYTRLRSKLHAVEKNLKDAIARQTLHQGVHLDEQVHTDFYLSDDIRKTYSDDSFRRLFWEQQLQALKVSNKKNVRWHPALIKWCLHLKFKSSSAYEVLRSTGVLTLRSS